MITSRQHQLLFLLIIIIGLLCRWIPLTNNGLWIDEIWSVQTSASTNSISQIIQLCIQDTHPPLFDIILHWCLSLSDDAEFTGRYLALFFGICGLFATYSYIRKILQSHNKALFGLTLLSLNYFHITYSFEGRFYTMLYLLSLISLGELYLFIKGNNIKHLLFFTIGSIALIYTHYYGSILLFNLGIITLLLGFKKQLSQNSFWKAIAAFGVIFIAYIPWLPNMLTREGGDSWMSSPDLVDFFNYFYLYSGKNPLEFLLLLIPLFSFIILPKKKLVFQHFMMGITILGFLIPFLISKLSTPLLHIRYTFIYFPAILILAAHFWIEFKPGWLTHKLRVIAYALVLTSIFINLAFIRKDFHSGFKDSWKEVASYLAPKVHSHDLIITEHNRYFNYYLKRNNLPIAHPIDTINHIKENISSLWFLETSRDSHQQLPSESSMEVINQKDFPNGFTLYHIRKEIK